MPAPREIRLDYREEGSPLSQIPLAAWLRQRYAQGWWWNGEPPQRLVIDGVPVQRYSFVDSNLLPPRA